MTFTVRQLKNILRLIKSYTKRLVLNCLQSLPISSQYIGPPRSYYLSSKDYWIDCEGGDFDHAVYTLDKTTSVSRRHAPKSIDRNIHWKFENRYLHLNPETCVSILPKGRIVNEGRGIITHNDRLILDVSRQFSIGKDHKEIKLSHKVLNSIQLPRCYSTTETVAVLAFLGGNNLFHWITEGLPKLAILRKSSPIDINAIDKFVVNKGFPAIQESLEMLGIHNSKLIFIDSECHIKAEKLIVPSFPGSTGDPPGWVCNFLRESLLKHRKPITPISNRLYISRAKAKHRKVVNEENVIHYLEGMGFKTIFLEDHDLATQISLFSNAEAVVAPHGAGLTNLMWCSPRTKVLEFFSPNYVNVCFWAIANQINLDYFYLVGDGKWPPDYIDPHIMSDDISVSIEKLSETLELMHLS